MMNKSPKAIAFIGWHNAGKTTLIRRILRELTAQGYRVGVMKSTKDEDAILDKPGTDSFLHRADGAAAVALIGPKELFFRGDNMDEPFEDLKNRLFYGVDLVLAEGFKHVHHLPKIEVSRQTISKEPLYTFIPNVIAVVADYGTGFTKQFDFTQIDELLDLIKNSSI